MLEITFLCLHSLPFFLRFWSDFNHMLASHAMKGQFYKICNDIHCVYFIIFEWVLYLKYMTLGGFRCISSSQFVLYSVQCSTSIT